MASALAYRYARALVDVVLETGSTLKPEDAVAQLRAVSQMVAQSEELRKALLTPAIQGSRKRAVMGKLMDELAAAQIIRNFIFVVIDHRRISMLTEIEEAFELALDERLGFARADVTSAEDLDKQRAAGSRIRTFALDRKADAIAFCSGSGIAGRRDGTHRIDAL